METSPFILSFFIFHLCYVSHCGASRGECVQVNTCKCKYRDNSVIDLAPIAKKNEFAFPYQSPQDPTSNFQYAYNPCYPVTDTIYCQDVAACQKYDDDIRYSIGKARTANFTKYQGTLSLVYNSTDQQTSVKTVIVKLLCDKSATKPSLVIRSEFPVNTYNFELTSVCCCPNGCTYEPPDPESVGLRLGFMMCAVFIVLMVVSLVAGIAFITLTKNSPQPEFIPNLSFWRSNEGTVEGINILFPPFFLVSHYPEVGRYSDFYIYAINKFGITDTEVSITKDGGLPSSGVEIGLITKETDNLGCFLRVHNIPNPGLRYGQYKASFSNQDIIPSLASYSEHTSYTFIKPKSDILNTRGVQTVTIYPESTISNNLRQKLPIGVQWTPGCNRITWHKDKRRNVNTGPRLELKTTDDAGLYRIQRPGRAKRGFYVQILVIAASCPENYFYNSESSTCEESQTVCSNGGVLSNNMGYCICPPTFWGTTCDCYVRIDGVDPMEPILAVDSEEGVPVYCGDLPGGNPLCKGYLVCLGDNYGCSCAPGWYGNACDRACPKGRWGVNCKQNCPKDEPDCNRFYGPSSSLREECELD